MVIAQEIATAIESVANAKNVAIWPKSGLCSGSIRAKSVSMVTFWIHNIVKEI
jgi:hypothetical protein